MFVRPDKALEKMTMSPLFGHKPGDRIKILRPRLDLWSKFLRWTGIGVNLEEVEIIIVESFDHGGEDAHSDTQ